MTDSPERERGGSDHDTPYTFGRKPSSRWPYPFTPRQFCGLLLLKARYSIDGLSPDDLRAPEEETQCPE